MEYLCYVIGFCSLVRILTITSKSKLCCWCIKNAWHPEMPFLTFMHFLKTDLNEVAKLNLAQAGHPWGRRCLVFMALVNSLHLGDHWEVGTGRSWAVWNSPKKPRISHRRLEPKKIVIHFDGWQFGSYSCMWQIFYQLSWVIYFYLEGEEGEKKWMRYKNLNSWCCNCPENLWICFLACRCAMCWEVETNLSTSKSSN